MKLNTDIIASYENLLLTNCSDNFFSEISASAYWKDTNGRYLECNDYFIHDSGLKSRSNILGHTDYDFWEHNAEKLKINDQEVILSNKPKTIIETVHGKNKKQVYLSQKIPLRSRSNKIIGIFGLSFLLDHCVNAADFSDIYSPKEAGDSSILSNRQKSCLYYLAKGMAVKEIAKTLNLSPRTVTNYLDAVKSKLDCSSRYELTMRASELGLI